MSSDIPAITARLEAATPGPWSVQVDDYAAEDGGVWPYVEGPGPGYRRILDSRDCEWADPEFIAHAPEDIRELLAEVKRLRDAIPDALHPEFGTEWREPDGIIWKAVHAVEVERDEARAEVERSQAITLQWMNSYEQMRAAGTELLADNARLAEKVARVTAERDGVLAEYLECVEGEWGLGCAPGDAEWHATLAQFSGEVLAVVRAALADPTTEAGT